MEMNYKIIAVDFDGTLAINSYSGHAEPENR